MFTPFNTKLAGVTFGHCQDSIKKWGCQDIGYFSLVRGPTNQHDPNAVGVWFLDDRLGYLQKPVAEKLTPVMDDGTKLTASFLCRKQHRRLDR